MRTFFIVALSAISIAAIILAAKNICCASSESPPSGQSTSLPDVTNALLVEKQESEKFILTGNYASTESAVFCTTYDTLIISRLPENHLYRIRRKSWLHLHAPDGHAFSRKYVSSCTASYDEVAGTLHCFPSGERGMVSAAYSEVVLGRLVYSKFE